MNKFQLFTINQWYYTLNNVNDTARCSIPDQFRSLDADGFQGSTSLSTMGYILDKMYFIIARHPYAVDMDGMGAVQQEKETTMINWVN